MPKCAVKKCRNNTLTTLKKDGVSYFRFPQNAILREKWRRIIANERSEKYYKPNKSSVVCSCHFLEEDLYKTEKGYQKVKKEAYPRIGIDISTSKILLLPKNEPSISGVCDNSESEIETPTTQNLLLPKNEPSISGVGDDSESALYIAIDISTTQNLLVPKNEPSISGVGDDWESEEKITVEASAQNEGASELVDPLSPASSGLSSFVDSPKTFYYKKSLRKYQISIVNKYKQVCSLRRKVKRLIKRNLTLKGIIADLKKKRREEETHCNDLTDNINENNAKVVQILGSKKKVSFAQYPPVLQEFAKTLFSYSPAAYEYVRDVFSQKLPHPSTLHRWHHKDKHEKDTLIPSSST